jgi:signal transduction histidine kinase
LRGFSHDLMNPLAVLRATVERLRTGLDGTASEREESLIDVENSVNHMIRMLEELMKVATTTREIIPLVPTPVDVRSLIEKLRRRLRALVRGRDLRINVTRTREAPDSIETDPLLLDRIVDNLLTNAVKYTEQGGISIEVDGGPTTLTLKVSDTGRGIPAEALPRSFEPGGSEPHLRAADSHGVGLSVVVQLLGRVGGRLEVMSTPGHGTTFWIHLPRSLPTDPSSPPSGLDRSPEERHRALVGKVVTVRPPPMG